jgi:aminopeptidase N
VTLGYADRIEQVTADLKSERVDVPAAKGREAPRYVLANGGGWAYGNFTLDAASLDYLATSLPDIADPLTRGAAWVTLWDSLLDGSLSAPRLVDLAMKALPRETDEQLTSLTLGYLRAAWWRFLRPAERAARQVSLETVLRAGVGAAKTASQKSAWFSAVGATAMSADTLAWLRNIWEEKETVPGLSLAEADYATLAQGLAVREVAGWKEILATQLGRMKSPDRRAQFAFVMPALSADPVEREKWFLSLADVANRRREPWVQEGLRYLHHPLRAANSIRFIAPSLQLMREIQRTGDIFFPGRWINATLSGHTSREAAEAVRAFLGGLPADYPARLRAIVLQNADELFRAAR